MSMDVVCAALAHSVEERKVAEFELLRFVTGY